MNDEKRKILEMLADGKITEAQATQLLEALGIEDREPSEPAEPVTPSITVNDADGSATIYPDGTIEVQDSGSGESAVIDSINRKINLTLHPDYAEIDVSGDELGDIHVNIPTEAAPAMPPAPPMPAMPAMPAMPPVPPTDDPEEMERYANAVQERMDEYERQMDEYAAQCEKNMDDYERQMDEYAAQCEKKADDFAARYEQQMAKLRAQAQPRPTPRPTVEISHSYELDDSIRPLTEDEYSTIYSTAYDAVYNTAFNALNLDPESEEFDSEVERIASQAQAAAEKAIADAKAAKAARPAPPKPRAGGLAGWLSSVGEEIKQAMSEIGVELGRDLDDAMDDVTDAIGDLKDALGDVVEEWQEELEEEMEEQAEEEEDEDEEDEDFLDFGPNFPFGEDGVPEERTAAADGAEYVNGEFVYRSWTALQTIDKLEVSWPFGQVRIAPWDGDHIEVVEYSKKSLRADQRCSVMVDDSRRLTVQEFREKVTARGLFRALDSFNLPSKRLDLLIPREQCGSIGKMNVQSASGTVQVSELSGGSFEIGAVSGRVQLKGLSSDSLEAGTTSGMLAIEDCSAEKLSAHSVSGPNSCKGFSAEKAELTTVSGTLNAHGNAEKFKISSVSGSASLMVDQCPEKVTMSAVSGSLKVRLPENAGFTVDYGSMSGHFSTSFPAQITPNGKKKNNGHAVYGDGQTKIEMHTTSGSMKVLKADGLSV